jgi:hypothetical protein
MLLLLLLLLDGVTAVTSTADRCPGRSDSVAQHIRDIL